MAAADKDTIYIDIDDEITGIIEKLKNSSSSVVALVLPKRATVLQSVVNMKLLKKAADSAKKNVVLVTSEAGLLPLAGLAGIAVAKTLSSAPAVPPAPELGKEAADSVLEDELPAEVSSGNAGQEPVGKLAGLPPKDADGVETVALDKPAEKDEAAKAAPTAAAAGAAAKSKKLKVPNFEKFRLLIALGVVALLLIIGGIILALNVLPHATIDIATDAQNYPTSLNLNLSTAQATLDPSSDTLPAKDQTLSKTYNQQVTSTGQRNDGNKASGSVNFTATECSSQSQNLPVGVQPPAYIPSGSGVTHDGLTFITGSDTTFNPNNGSVNRNCIAYPASSATPVTAQSGGANYNGSSSNWAVAGRSDVSGQGSTSGGTDDFVQVVSQGDINNAKSKLSTNNNSQAQQYLINQLKAGGYFPLSVTFLAASPSTTTSVPAGSAATTVTVTEAINYSMFGVHKSDLKTLVDNSVDGQINTSQQSVLSEGIDSATFTVQNQSSTSAQLTMNTNATAGPYINVAQIKKQSLGKKAGEIQSSLSGQPGIKSVKVSFSPFWVDSVPDNVSKVTVNIAKPKG